jgi:hypothetical protein
MVSLGYSRPPVSANISEKDTLKIEYIDPKGVVSIGGKKLKIGNTFLAGEKIAWATYDTQAIKTRNLRTGEIIRFCSSGFSRYTAQNLVQWYIQYHRTFDKGSSSQIEKMSEQLAQPHYIIDDTLFINSSLEQNASDKFYIARIISPECPNVDPFPFPFDDETNEIVITSNYLSDLGIDPTDGPITLAVSYWCQRQEIPLTNKMIILYLPHKKTIK